jgi:hypothetical protein
MTEWRPIETAPKDGTEVLLWTTSFDGEPVAVSGWYFNAALSLNSCWLTAFGAHGEPTLWQPLVFPDQKDR